VRPSLAERVQDFSRGTALVLVVLGVVVLFGWVFDIEILHRTHSTHRTIKPNTALLFVLLGLSMLRVRGGRDRFGCLLGCVVAAVGAATLAEYIAHVDLAIDAALVGGRRDLSAAMRMSAFTASGFVLLGTASALLNANRWLHVAHGAAYVVLAGTFLALCSLMYGVDAILGTVSAYTVAGGLLASVTVFASRPDIGLVAIFVSDTAGGALLRRLVPAIAVFPVVFAHFGLQAESGGLYDTAFGDAVLVTATVAILFFATAAIARTLHRSELARNQVEDRLLARERELAESESKYRDLYENAADMLASVRIEGSIVVDCNQTLLDALLRSREEVIGRIVFELYAPVCADKVRSAHSEHVRSGAVADVELALRRSDGTTLKVTLSASAVRDEHGRVVASRAVWHDISRRRALEELRERDRFFALSVDLVCISNSEGYFLQLSPSFCTTLGLTMQELLGCPYLEFVHPADRDATRAVAQRVASGEHIVQFTNRFRCRDGSYRWLQWRARPDQDGLIYSIARDITDDRQAADELRRSEESLRASLREREVLLQEVHHRVKNNLQIVSSLIGMQVRQISLQEGRDALLECQRRIQTIALIHEKLYQSDDYARVPFSDYASGLVANIFEAASDRSQPIGLEVGTDSISLPVDRAIPCGLILNELVANALKHAFRGRDRGCVRVQLRREEAEVMLAVSDDGVGLPPDFDVHRAPTLGLQLVTALVEQLRGRLEIERRAGTTFRVRFQGGVAR
jgi:PAS domain S-box-containing protein